MKGVPHAVVSERRERRARTAELTGLGSLLPTSASRYCAPLSGLLTYRGKFFG